MLFTIAIPTYNSAKLIEKAIKKYIGASDVPVIFFEDK